MLAKPRVGAYHVQPDSQALDAFFGFRLPGGIELGSQRS